MATTDAPPVSPFRARLDQLASDLIEGALATQPPMTELWIQAGMARLGWDSGAMFSSGLLAGVSDAALATLVDALSNELDDSLLADTWAADALSTELGLIHLADALAELRAALRP